MKGEENQDTFLRKATNAWRAATKLAHETGALAAMSPDLMQNGELSRPHSGKNLR